MTPLRMRGVSTFVSLLVYGIIFSLTCTSDTACNLFYGIVYPTIASDYIGMIFIVSFVYTITYWTLMYVYRDKKRRGV